MFRIGPGEPVYRGDLALVLDGAVYNREELTERLGRAPCTDADLVLSLIEAQGFKGLALVNGDFAGALFNQNNNELTPVPGQVRG